MTLTADQAREIRKAIFTTRRHLRQAMLNLEDVHRGQLGYGNGRTAADIAAVLDLARQSVTEARALALPDRLRELPSVGDCVFCGNTGPLKPHHGGDLVCVDDAECLARGWAPKE